MSGISGVRAEGDGPALPAEFRAAERDFRLLVQADDGNAQAHFVLGMIALRDGRPGEAVGHIGRAIAADPANPDFHYYLAAACSALGREAEVEPGLRAALEQDPGHREARMDLGRLLASRGRFAEAADCYAAVLERDPGDADAHLHLGAALAHLGRPQAAEEHYGRAVALGLDHPDARRFLGHGLAARGRLDEAAASYARALELKPGDADTLNDLGIVYARQRRHEDAATAFRAALEARPDFPDAHNNLGNALRNRGRHEEALAAYHEALRLRPEYPEAYNNLAIALRRLGKFDEALAAYHEALRLKPDYAEAHNNLGYALASRGKLDAAALCYRQALRLKPDYAEAWGNLGGTLSDMGRHDEAVAAFRRAVELQPGDPRLRRHLANALARQDRLDEAAVCFEEAIGLAPRHPDAYNDLGIVRARQDRFEEAAALYRQALELRPQYPEALSNLGNAERNLGRFDEAVALYRRALQLRPQYAEAHNNLGITLSEMGRFDEAVACYTLCLRLRPNHADAHLNRALTWLRKGDFARGWAEYESRWRRRAVSARPLIMPPWNGFPPAGRRILLITEQGLGDTLQFIRYAPLLKARGATVILECPERLLKILSRTPGIDEVVPQGADWPEHDFYAPLLSLPGLLDTDLGSIPGEVPYIHPDPALVDRWRAELSGCREFKVGINWQGNPKYGGDRHRSMRLEFFEPLARVPGVRLFSLQKNHGSEQLAELGGQFEVVDLGPRLDETEGPFQDTAAVMKNLDLFVTSDTAVAHLAGSLGVPVWVALSVSAGWQWLTGREDCPWYPTMRLFRQGRLLDWAPVFERIAGALRDLMPAPAPSGLSHERLTIEVTASELIDRVAALEAEASESADPAHLEEPQSALVVLRDRIMSDHPDLVTAADELRSLHGAIRGVEQDLRAYEREGDTGPRFVTLARSLVDLRGRREVVLLRLTEWLGRRDL